MGRETIPTDRNCPPHSTVCSTAVICCPVCFVLDDITDVDSALSDRNTQVTAPKHSRGFTYMFRIYLQKIYTVNIFKKLSLYEQ